MKQYIKYIRNESSGFVCQEINTEIETGAKVVSITPNFKGGYSCGSYITGFYVLFEKEE